MELHFTVFKERSLSSWSSFSVESGKTIFTTSPAPKAFAGRQWPLVNPCLSRVHMLPSMSSFVEDLPPNHGQPMSLQLRADKRESRMARNRIVWAIDLGQFALKALACRPEPRSGKLEVLDVEFLEYEVPLVHPAVDQAAVIRHALARLTAKGRLGRAAVVVAIPTSKTHCRSFVVEANNQADVAAQVQQEIDSRVPQDPSAKMVVAWQELFVRGNVHAFGVAAALHEVVIKYLRPFREAGLRVQLVQPQALALARGLIFDRLGAWQSLAGQAALPPTYGLLSIGSECCDLALSDGKMIWLRTVPVGGHSLTKALQKRFEVSVQEAEQLKRHWPQIAEREAARQAFAAPLRDLTEEVAKSFRFFSSTQPDQPVKELFVVGNSLKLTALQAALCERLQPLGFPVTRLDTAGQFLGLCGPLGSPVAEKTWEKHAPNFATCYGLAVDGLEMLGEGFNLAPEELRPSRPWQQQAKTVVSAGQHLVGQFASVLWRGCRSAWGGRPRWEDRDPSA